MILTIKEHTQPIKTGSKVNNNKAQQIPLMSQTNSDRTQPTINVGLTNDSAQCAQPK